MRRFLQNIALFALPLAAALGYLLWDTPPAQYRYLMVQKDCRTGSWIYRRLFESAAPVDVAFLGSSKTMCDVDDALLEEKLHSVTQQHLRMANFGVCRVGTNLHFLIAQHLFSQKSPKLVVYEVSHALDVQSHMHFPYLATIDDALAAPTALTGDYATDLELLAWYRLVYQRERFLGIERKFDDFLTDSLHSFMRVEHDGVADPGKMAEIHASRSARAADMAQPLQGLAAWRLRHPLHYLQALKALCAAHGAKLVLLYLPGHGFERIRPREMELLETIGPVWLPPDSVFSRPELHMDENHLNQRGAAMLSDWLTERLADELRR